MFKANGFVFCGSTNQWGQVDIKFEAQNSCKVHTHHET